MKTTCKDYFGFSMEKVCSYSSTELISIWSKQHGIDISNQFEFEQELSLFCDNESGLCIFEPESCAGNEAFYGDLQAFDWYYEAEKWEYGVAATAIAPGRSVLEVGCGTGDFLRILKARDVEAEGIDMNPAAIMKVTQDGMSGRCIGLEKFASNAASRYDAVVALQVIEHLSDPVGCLLKCIQLLKDEGTLIVAVPNHDSFIRHCENRALDLPPHHMSRWTAKAFRKFAALHNLNVEFLKAEPLQSKHIDWFVDVMFQRMRKHRLLRLFSKRPIIFAVRLLMRLGGRYLFKGHTILCVFRFSSPATVRKYF